MTRILITDAEQRSSLAVARSLGRAGYELVVASCRSRPLAGASRYVSDTVAVPDPYEDAGGFVEAVDAAIDRHGIEVLIPMTDVSAPLVLPLRDSKPGLTIPYPALDDYLGISDKAHLMAVSETLDVPVPDQVVLECPPEGIDGLGEALSYPLVLKPARSAIIAGGRVQKIAVQIPSTPEEARTALREYPAEAYPVLAQRHIVGPGLGVFALAVEGKTVVAFAHRRLREKPPTGGVSVYRESVPVRSDLREASERILEHFRWTGVAMIEFKEESTSGTPYIMEVNGRFWGSLQLAVDAGVDFPRLLVDATSGVPLDVPSEFRYGIRSRWLWGDVDHLIAVMRTSAAARRAHPGVPGKVGGLARFLIPWQPGDRWEVLRPSDPRPFFRETAEWFRSLGR